MSYGKIHLKIGPMWSGKSTWLRNIARKLSGDTIIILPNAPMRKTFRDLNTIVVHGDEIQQETINEIMNTYDNICIDEGQFIKNIIEVAEYFANNGKNVYISALEATFEQKPFGKICELIPKCEKVEKATETRCCECDDNDVFTKRVCSESSETILLGDSPYKNYCRRCWNERQSKLNISN